jgi:hypothetical protein
VRDFLATAAASVPARVGQAAAGEKLGERRLGVGLLDKLLGRERSAGERTGMSDQMAQTSEDKAEMDREAAAGEAPGTHSPNPDAEAS